MLTNPRKLKANPNLMSSQTSPTNQIKIISWNIEGGITNKNILTRKSPHPKDFQIPDHKDTLLEAAQNLK